MAARATPKTLGCLPPTSRRCFMAGGIACLAATPGFAAALPVVRLGTLPFGTVQWVADVILRHGLDSANGFTLQTSRLANTEAGKVALMGHAVDVAVSDWPFVAAQRAHGGTLTFAPFSSSLGGIMVPAASPVRRLADLKGARLGVAGGGADKSWLIVQAALRKQGLNTKQDLQISFGAPPLLSATMARGGLDALLTFWNFAARLQAAGMREAISVAECARIIGLPFAPVLVGYVFDALWASANRAAMDGFLAASWAATGLLASQPDEWAKIRPLMDAEDDSVFENLRRRFLAGTGRPKAAVLIEQANSLLVALAKEGVAAPATLPAGVFWRGEK